MAEEIKKCNHEGHYGSAGVVPINEPKSMNIILVLYCKICGEGMAKNIRLQKFEIPAPQVKIQSPFSRKS